VVIDGEPRVRRRYLGATTITLLGDFDAFVAQLSQSAHSDLSDHTP